MSRHSGNPTTPPPEKQRIEALKSMGLFGETPGWDHENDCVIPVQDMGYPSPPIPTAHWITRFLHWLNAKLGTGEKSKRKYNSQEME